MDLFQKFYDRALRFLSYRPRSEKEIADFLAKKKVTPVVVAKILKKLKEQNLVNDREFTKWWVEQRTKFRPRGLRVIKMELKQKGIKPELIEKIISNDQFLISNKEAVKKLIIKKITNYKGLPKRELYHKLSQFLLRRGFDWDTVKNAVDDSLGK
ncbi:RecX family transcriptional regulator [Candidatus Microgenomates bacterium]|nr:RecX family transcriptional regulator [Candidatus Microgenomates bacterium]MBI2622442.1 RecX family transcriptional regulator [Candidatus Microgenomates bacterium]